MTSTNKFSGLERGIVKKVIIEVEYPNGESKNLEIDPQKDDVEAIFWSDKSVLEILAPYYKKVRYGLSNSDIEEMWNPKKRNWEERPTLLLKGGPTWTIPTCCYKPDCGIKSISEIVTDKFSDK
ncbi:hypothetical protein [Vibrio diabolicus]|uniref:hypothetical protein n=1 Tax=Vibrio diabolicus TaxID=50719 RepID=UPI001594B587|nr:hypothetical protein [Vibrio diabolicus]NVC52932.1 hypothetical protein [Vibrio diabolicus]